MNRSKVVPNFPRMIPTPLIFFRAAPAHARSAFLRYRHYEEVPEGGSESKNWREANLFVTPRKPTCYNGKSRAAPRSRAKRVFAFSALWGSTGRRLWIEKLKRSKFFCYPMKNHIVPWYVLCGPQLLLTSEKMDEPQRSWDLRQCELAPLKNQAVQITY